MNRSRSDRARTGCGSCRRLLLTLTLLITALPASAEEPRPYGGKEGLDCAITGEQLGMVARGRFIIMEVHDLRITCAGRLIAQAERVTVEDDRMFRVEASEIGAFTVNFADYDEVKFLLTGTQAARLR